MALLGDLILLCKKSVNFGKYPWRLPGIPNSLFSTETDGLTKANILTQKFQPHNFHFVNTSAASAVVGTVRGFLSNVPGSYLLWPQSM